MEAGQSSVKVSVSVLCERGASFNLVPRARLNEHRFRRVRIYLSMDSTKARLPCLHNSVFVVLTSFFSRIASKPRKETATGSTI